MDEVKMMVSCVVVKDNRKIVRVSFLRGKDYADGFLPDGVIEKSGGAALPSWKTTCGPTVRIF